MKKITILMPYFGKFPEWAPLFFETLKRNSTIDFIFYTDCDYSKYTAPNIIFRKITFNEYIEMVKTKINVDFKPANAYKLCDLRPLYGVIHYDDIKDSDFYGWSDMDILFGDIRSFYTEEILSYYDVLSVHEIRISGHLAIFRNTRKNIKKYKKIYDWKSKLENPHFVGIDEHGITNAYMMTIFDKFNEKFHKKFDNNIIRHLKTRKTKKLYLKEQYTTPFTLIPWLDKTINNDQPDTWFYKDGIITNSRDANRNFIYIHLMNFKNSQWRHDGTKAPWEGRDKICFAEAKDMAKGIIINKEGIFPI